MIKVGLTGRAKGGGGALPQPANVTFVGLLVEPRCRLRRMSGAIPPTGAGPAFSVRSSHGDPGSSHMAS